MHTASPTQAVNPNPETVAAFAELPDNSPIIMLNLLSFSRPDGRSHYNDYALVSRKEITRNGGRVVYHGRSTRSDDWENVALVFYPRRASWLNMQKSPAYQAAIPDRTAGLDARLLFSFKSLDTSSQPLDTVIKVTPGGICAIYCIMTPTDNIAFADIVGELMTGAGGEVVLDLVADFPLVTDEPWQRFGMVRFTRTDTFESFINSADWINTINQQTNTGSKIMLLSAS